jgi:hypothetical protein
MGPGLCRPQVPGTEFFVIVGMFVATWAIAVSG